MLFAMIRFRRERGSATLLAAALAVPVIGAAIVIAGVHFELRGVSRLLNFAQSATDTTGRQILWAAAMHLAEQHPVFGAGFASFHATADNLQGIGTYPHNIFLELLAETGLIGFLLFTSAFAAAIVMLLRAMPRLAFLESAIWLAAFCVVLVEVNVSGSVTNRFIAFVLGITLGLTARTASENASALSGIAPGR